MIGTVSSRRSKLLISEAAQVLIEVKRQIILTGVVVVIPVDNP